MRRKKRAGCRVGKIATWSARASTFDFLFRQDKDLSGLESSGTHGLVAMTSAYTLKVASSILAGCICRNPVCAVLVLCQTHKRRSLPFLC